MRSLKLFETSPTNISPLPPETATPGDRARNRAHQKSATSAPPAAFETWTRGELALAHYLVSWAMPKTRGDKLGAYIEARRRVRAELETRNADRLDRFARKLPPWPAEHAHRWAELYRLFLRTL